MLHPLVLIVVIVTIGRDLVGVDPVAPLATSRVWGLTLGFMAGIAVATHLRLWIAGRRLDRTGRTDAIAAADRTLAASRGVIGVAYLAAVFGAGWLDAVRGAVGDWVLIDELVAMLPPLLAYTAGWWSYAPIERRMHEAVTFRALDTGAPVHAFPGRWAYTLERLRSTALGALAPILLILGWSEGVTQLAGASGLLDRLGDAEAAAAMAGAQLVGAGLVLALSPPIIVRIWGATRLPNGPLRDRVRELCRRAGARVGGVRVWRTRGVVLNAAVLGLTPGARTLLLTDGLIERLEPAQLDAVILHEIAHIRRRHIPWLIVALVVPFAAAMITAEGVGRIVGAAEPAPQWAQGLAVAGSMLVALWVFGRVSRLFERQADAFAAASLARAEGSAVVTPAAAQAMSGALERVARLNHIPPGKFMWRHGSIATRRRRLGDLVGAPVEALHVDRRVRRVKLALVALAAVAAAGLAWIVSTGDDAGALPPGEPGEAVLA
ncbi:MAG: hypothetical protein D6693_10940 [Planctomycetota bacterium]|nr:MAG: hypothetical protein D6693_10940 [Planctomycetota bacterium]